MKRNRFLSSLNLRKPQTYTSTSTYDQSRIGPTPPRKLNPIKQVKTTSCDVSPCLRKKLFALNQSVFEHSSKIHLDSYRKNLIRDFGYLNKKNIYEKELDYIDLKKKNEYRKVEQIERNLKRNKARSLARKRSVIVCEEKSIHLDNSEDCLKKYYDNRIVKRINIAKQISNEIRDINSTQYEEITDENGNFLTNNKLINDNNLSRKIKNWNIQRNNFDHENDELCERNHKELKSLMYHQMIQSMKTLKGICPPFIKKKFKITTINKFSECSGIYF